jgi:hypothetical protein
MDTSKYRLISCTLPPGGGDNYTVVVWDGKQNLVGSIPATKINAVFTGDITNNLKPLEVGLHEARKAG